LRQLGFLVLYTPIPLPNVVAFKCRRDLIADGYWQRVFFGLATDGSKAWAISSRRTVHSVGLRSPGVFPEDRRTEFLTDNSAWPVSARHPGHVTAFHV